MNILALPYKLIIRIINRLFPEIARVAHEMGYMERVNEERAKKRAAAHGRGRPKKKAPIGLLRSRKK